MPCNIGTNDRIIRVILGVFILLLGINFHSWLALFGLIPLLTALLRWCPAYLPFHISTCNKQAELMTGN